MKKVITQDGSLTIYSEEYHESYHSTTGAIEESFKKYAEPCKVKDGMRILDICFGLGYNTLAAIHKAKVEVIGLEKDSAILNELTSIEVPDNLKKDYEKIKEASQKGNYDDGETKITIITGDATQTIKNAKGKFDAVFLDPFSPPKNPELWTKEFFIEIKNKMKENAALATYSCARKVRDNLREAGFILKDGPKVRRRGPCTLAYR